MAAHTTNQMDVLATIALVTTRCKGSAPNVPTANALELHDDKKQQCYLKVPKSFAPLYGGTSRKTIKWTMGQSATIACDIRVLEQNLELRPLCAGL